MELGGRRGGRLPHSGHHRQQIGKVAAHQRQRRALVVGDVLPALARIRLQLQRHVGHFNRGLGLARRQFQVNALPVAHGNRDGFCLGNGETRGAGGDGVNAHAQRGNFIIA